MGAGNRRMASTAVGIHSLTTLEDLEMTLEQARKKARRFHRDAGCSVTIFKDIRDNKFTRNNGPYGCIDSKTFVSWGYSNHELVEVVG